MFIEANRDVEVSTTKDSQVAAREFYRRPADERYASLLDLHTEVKAREESSFEAEPFPFIDLKAMAKADGTGVVFGRDSAEFTADNGAEPNPWSFGQTLRLANSPVQYLANKEPESIARNFNEDVAMLASQGDRRQVRPYLQKPSKGDPLTLRAINGRDYARLYDRWIVERFLKLEEQGWCVPPTWDGEPAGLYLSDRDLWVMMVDSPEASLVVKDPHGDREERLHRVVIAFNSMVGAKSVGGVIAWVNALCGNHQFFGLDSMVTFRMRHRGSGLYSRVADAMGTLFKLGNERDIDSERARVQLAMDAKLGEDETKALSAVVRRTGLPKGTVADAFVVAREEGSDPLYAWGAVQGITALARGKANMDTRFQLESASAALMPEATAGRKLAPVTVDV